MPARDDYEMPDITVDDGFRQVVKKLALYVTILIGDYTTYRIFTELIVPKLTRDDTRYITDAIELPSTFEQLRTTSAGAPLRVLVEHLSANCHNSAIVNALL